MKQETRDDLAHFAKPPEGLEDDPLCKARAAYAQALLDKIEQAETKDDKLYIWGEVHSYAAVMDVLNDEFEDELDYEFSMGEKVNDLRPSLKLTEKERQFGKGTYKLSVSEEKGTVWLETPRESFQFEKVNDPDFIVDSIAGKILNSEGLKSICKWAQPIVELAHGPKDGWPKVQTEEEWRKEHGEKK